MDLMVQVDSASFNVASMTSSENDMPTSPVLQDTTRKHILLRLLMSRREIGSIIGKNGESINTFREKSGAKIKISEKGVGERIISIYGETQDVILVCKLFCRKLEWDARHKRKRTGPYFDNARITPKIILRTLFPSSICGYILGKSGINVRHIRQETGCLLEFSPNKLPNSTERVLFLSGDALAVCDAAERICKRIATVKNKIPIIPYCPSNLPSTLCKFKLVDEFPTASNDLGSGEIPGGRRCRMTQFSRERATTALTINSLFHYRRSLACNLIAALPDPRFRPNDESEEQDKLVQYLHQHSLGRELLGSWDAVPSATLTLPHSPTSVARSGNQVDANCPQAEEANSTNSLNFPFPPLHTEKFYIPQDPHPPFHFNGSTIAIDRAANNAAPPRLDKAEDAALQSCFIHELTYEMVLPNDLVGCIIGRGGLKINEIRRISQANIKISNDDKDNNVRQITIAGTAQAINVALLLIRTSLLGCGA
ncbi:Poly(rC)-binding protein 3 [Sparganum proliferum]